MTEMVEATITDLDALLADSTHDRCQVAAVVREIRLFRRWRWHLGTEGDCGRPAAAVVTVVCPEHGERVHAICRAHLALLRRSQTKMKCAKCDREVAVRDLAS